MERTQTPRDRIDRAKGWVHFLTWPPFLILSVSFFIIAGIGGYFLGPNGAITGGLLWMVVFFYIVIP